MGYERHNAIIVTTWWNPELIREAHEMASKLFHCVTPIIGSEINAYESFLIPPDGSKEGWAESDLNDKSRELFIKWIDNKRYSDGSTPFDWVEVQYGDDNGDTRIISHSDEKHRQLPGALE